MRGFFYTLIICYVCNNGKHLYTNTFTICFCGKTPKSYNPGYLEERAIFIYIRDNRETRP